ncbi:MAG: AI-2E family transporter [Verrucomicrobiota bacterium]|nr:AI-2E family transporter [Verrucomicrobiota bacterium]
MHRFFRRAQLFCLGIIAFVALNCAAYFAAPVLIPIVLALLASFVLRPLHKKVSSLGLGDGWASLVVILLISGALAWGFYGLVQPARNWISKMPDNIKLVEKKVRGYLRPMKEIQMAAQQVENITNPESLDGRAPVKESSVASSVVLATGSLVKTAAVALLLVLFFLAFGSELFHSLTRQWEGARKLGSIGDSISQYMATITVINFTLGAAQALALWAMGMPNPLLWGLMAALLTYIPYVGAMVGTLIVAGVSLISFDSPNHALLVPAVYAILVSLEGGLITPIILGKRFKINPLVISIFLLWLGWLWGIIGALVAVPILVMFKVVCEQFEFLQPLGAIICHEDSCTVAAAPPQEKSDLRTTQ